MYRVDFRVILIFISSFYFIVNAQDVLISTPLGSVRGIISKTRRGHNYYVFRGIPYAQAPINELRWKPPMPIEQWSSEFDATHDGPACYSPHRPPLPLEPMSEDCLNLNIYTPNLRKNSTKLQPVLVHIHGGGFTFLSGTSRMYNPIYLMESEIIVVTFNYRLNIFGFLSADNANVPGNAGMLDQVEVLKWVANNIKYFGGDKNQITLSGHSAGAMSVVAHLASPLSRGLFHRAIPMSGSFTFHWDIPNHRLDIVNKLGNHFECNTLIVDEIIKCLRAIKPGKIVTGFNVLPEFLIFPLVIFHPIVEKDYGQKRFLTESPIQAFLNNRLNVVPVLTGMTEFDFGPRLAHMILEDDNMRFKFENNFADFAPIALQYEKGTERSRYISNTLEENFVPKPLLNDVQTLQKFQYVSN